MQARTKADTQKKETSAITVLRDVTCSSAPGVSEKNLAFRDRTQGVFVHTFRAHLPNYTASPKPFGTPETLCDLRCANCGYKNSSFWGYDAVSTGNCLPKTPENSF
jgi:hypothetical protein